MDLEIQIEGKYETYTLEHYLDSKKRVLFGVGNDSGKRVAAKQYKLGSKLSHLYHREKAIALILQEGHPNVMPVEEFIDADSGRYILFPYVQGETLCTINSCLSPLAVPQVVPIMDGIFAGLIFVHDQDVIHRDIKAANVFIKGDEEIDGAVPEVREFTSVIFDFDCGTYPVFFEDISKIVGTREYIAPEIWNEKNASESTDQYSLGILLYELFADERPFMHDPDFADRKEQYRAFHTRVRPQDPRKKGADISDKLAAVVMKSIEKRPENRYTSIRHFRDAFMGAV